MTMIPGLLCPLFIIAIPIVIFVMVARAMARSGLGAGLLSLNSLNVLTELAEDGFWIVSCPARPSWIIHFHYWANGVRHNGLVPYQPGNDGRQFVYTGLRPERVVIVRIEQPANVDPSIVVPPIIISSGMDWDPSTTNQPGDSGSSSSASQFPTAY